MLSSLKEIKNITFYKLATLPEKAIAKAKEVVKDIRFGLVIPFLQKV